MNIKKIIREEITNTEEDWEWAKDVKPMTNEFTKETFLEFLDVYDIIFKWDEEPFLYTYRLNDVNVIEIHKDGEKIANIGRGQIQRITEIFNDGIYKVVEFRGKS